VRFEEQPKQGLQMSSVVTDALIDGLIGVLDGAMNRQTGKNNADRSSYTASLLNKSPILSFKKISKSNLANYRSYSESIPFRVGFGDAWVVSRCFCV